MHKTDSFEQLIQKALQCQDFPVLPASILKAWQAPKSESSAKWLWIIPGVIFVLGIGVGVELAPLGLSNAFSAMKSALFSLGRAIPADAWKWAFALLLGVLAFSVDSFRSIIARLK